MTIEKFLVSQTVAIEIILAASALLTACGGGGDSGNSNGTTTGNNPPAAASAGDTPSGSGSSTANDNATVSEESYWSMDNYRYTNGGFSMQSNVKDSFPTTTNATLLTVSTATPTSNDKGKGAYSGGILYIFYYGPGSHGQGDPGIYNISAIPSKENRDNKPIGITVRVGGVISEASTDYFASSGKIAVTKDANGKYHFSSIGPISVTRVDEKGGGVPNAPAFMTLSIVNAY